MISKSHYEKFQFWADRLNALFGLPDNRSQSENFLIYFYHINHFKIILYYDWENEKNLIVIKIHLDDEEITKVVNSTYWELKAKGEFLDFLRAIKNPSLMPTLVSIDWAKNIVELYMKEYV